MLFFAAWLAVSHFASGEPRIVAFGEIPADARDAAGDTLGGIGSAIAIDPRTGDILALPDRGAGDGTIPFRPRYHLLGIEAEPGDPRHLKIKVLKTVLFTDEKGKFMTGLLPDRMVNGVPMCGDAVCLDPEAIAIGPEDTLYVSDEYGTFLYEFGRDGRMRRRIELPDHFKPRAASGEVTRMAGTPLIAGRDENRGAEGMAVIPSRTQAALIFQSALVQDGGRSGGTSRLVVLDLATGAPVAEYGYLFHDPEKIESRSKRLAFDDLSVNDLIALSESEFLVLERDNLGRDGDSDPQAACYKAVWRVSVAGATNLIGTRYSHLPGTNEFAPLDRSAPIKFVSKTLLFNLAELAKAPGGPGAETLAAKWEGIAVLRQSPQLVLLMAADNDFLARELHFDGTMHPFKRAKDAVPTQFFEIEIDRP